jgi:hypothetical protein
MDHGRLLAWSRLILLVYSTPCFLPKGSTEVRAQVHTWASERGLGPGNAYVIDMPASKTLCTGHNS